jgi:hypothetical protein
MDTDPPHPQRRRVPIKIVDDPNIKAEQLSTPPSTSSLNSLAQTKTSQSSTMMDAVSTRLLTDTEKANTFQELQRNREGKNKSSLVTQRPSSAKQTSQGQRSAEISTKVIKLGASLSNAMSEQPTVPSATGKPTLSMSEFMRLWETLSMEGKYSLLTVKWFICLLGGNLTSEPGNRTTKVQNTVRDIIGGGVTMLHDRASSLEGGEERRG